jgi:hypothetical protein
MDNLKDQKDKILVYKVTFNGSATLINDNAKNIAEWLECDIAELEEDEEYEVSITKLYMNKDEYDNLPEFEGY